MGCGRSRGHGSFESLGFLYLKGLFNAVQRCSSGKPLHLAPAAISSQEPWLATWKPQTEPAGSPDTVTVAQGQ